MEVLMNKLRSVAGDVLEKPHLTNSKPKPTHNHQKHPQHQGNRKENKTKTKTKTKMKMKRKDVSPVPAGFFPVYVGPEENNKQRFVVKVEMANHRMFQILLEDAESKYGMNRQGPISLPCDVDLFYKVLAEMEMDMEDGIEDDAPLAASWNFIGLGGYGLNKLLRVDDKNMDSCNSYSLLNHSKLLKLNH